MNTKAYYKARLRAKGQVTIPPEVRTVLNLNEGDDLFFSITEEGRVVIDRVQIVPPDQTWFWTERWQQMEQAALADIEAGRVQRYGDVDKALDALEEIADAGN
jgi:antitoxin PrlF